MNYIMEAYNRMGKELISKITFELWALLNNLYIINVRKNNRRKLQLFSRFER